MLTQGMWTLANEKRKGKVIVEKKSRSGFIPGFLIGMLAMFIVAGGIGAGIYFSNTDIAVSKKATAVSQAEKKLKSLEQVIHNYYLEDVEQSNLTEGLYKGLFAGIGDPYSVYYTKEEYEELMQATSGKYYGIGALVSQDVKTGVISISKVFKDAPADKAGMKAEDVIYKVDDDGIEGKEVDKVVAMMKGEKGTQVKVTVYRPSEKKYKDLMITRDEVKVPTVESRMLNKETGYIQITEFDEVTGEQFTKALNQLKKQGMKKVVFDVRDNPGGSYATVCDILDEILPAGTLVYTKDKYGNEEKQESEPDSLNMPMVVLQNENSASASEIFAGAIQDFKAGKIIGTQSFGKGIVQQIIPLGDGSAVKLTVEKYYTPSGKNIHGKGITPDIKVEQGEDEKKDIQLEKAIEELK